MITFAGTCQLDPSVERVRGPKDTQALQTAVIKHLPILDGIDVDLKLKAQSGLVNWELRDQVNIEGSYQQDKQSLAEHYKVGKKMALPWYAPATTVLKTLVYGSVEIYENIKTKGKFGWTGTKDALSGFAIDNYRAENAENFVVRAFTQIRDEIRKLNLPTPPKSDA